MIALSVSNAEAGLLNVWRTAHSSDYTVRLAVRIMGAVHQAKDAIRVPAIVPEMHGRAILSRKPGGRTLIGVEGDVGVDGSRPFRRAAPFNGRTGRSSHGVGALCLQRFDSADEYGVVPNGAGQAGNSLLAGRQTCLPEGAQGSAGFVAKSECGFGSGGTSVALRQERERNCRTKKDCQPD
jgi:hypothetical protein